MFLYKIKVPGIFINIGLAHIVRVNQQNFTFVGVSRP